MTNGFVRHRHLIMAPGPKVGKHRYGYIINKNDTAYTRPSDQRTQETPTLLFSLIYTMSIKLVTRSIIPTWPIVIGGALTSICTLCPR